MYEKDTFIYILGRILLLCGVFIISNRVNNKTMKITSRFDADKVIYESEKTTICEAVVEAVLSDADLRGANLSDASLSDANLRGANLRDANLRGANLRDANLRGANLSDANLSDADLSDANLSDADLSGANLSDADLRGAEFMGVRFYGKGGITKINKTQIEALHAALGIVVEE